MPKQFVFPRRADRCPPHAYRRAMSSEEDYAYSDDEGSYDYDEDDEEEEVPSKAAPTVRQVSYDVVSEDAIAQRQELGVQLSVVADGWPRSGQA